MKHGSGSTCNPRRRRRLRQAVHTRTSCTTLPLVWRGGALCRARGCRAGGLPRGALRRASPPSCPQRIAHARPRATWRGTARIAVGRAPGRGFHIACRARARRVRLLAAGGARAGAPCAYPEQFLMSSQVRKSSCSLGFSMDLLGINSMLQRPPSTRIKLSLAPWKVPGWMDGGVVASRIPSFSAGLARRYASVLLMSAWPSVVSHVV